MSSEIDVFFRALAQRKPYENDLSDMLWAVMEAVPDMKRDVCDFLSDGVVVEGPLSVQREVSDTTGRPDLVFHGENMDLVVEVKIWDQNYHLDQYGQSTPGKKLALLSSHAIPDAERRKCDQKGWNIKYWCDLADHLKARQFGGNQRLVDGFLSYTKEVCVLKKIHKLRFDPKSLYSLVSFLELAKRIVGSTSVDGASLGLYSHQSRGFEPGWCGAVYEVDVKKVRSSKQIWPIFGVWYFEPDKIKIAISLDLDWNEDVISKIRKSKMYGSVDGVIIEDYDDMSGINVFLPDDEYEQLLMEDLASQERRLKDFFVRTNSLFVQLLR